MNGGLEEAFRALQREYVAVLPERLDEVRSLAGAAARGDAGAGAALRVKLHQLAGAAGSYGLPELSDAARALLATLEAQGAAACAPGLDALEALHRAAAQRLG